MKRWSGAAIVLLLIGFTAFSYSHQASGQTGAGWVTLFDGKNLDNWNQIGDANWSLADGVVVADKGNGFLVSKNNYTDFQLRAEFWVDDDANSGIFIRCTDPANVTGKTAYEVNIWDRRPDPTYGTGAIVDVAKVSPMPKAAGKWNVYVDHGQGLDLHRDAQRAKDRRRRARRQVCERAAGTSQFACRPDLILTWLNTDNFPPAYRSRMFQFTGGPGHG